MAIHLKPTDILFLKERHPDLLKRSLELPGKVQHRDGAITTGHLPETLHNRIVDVTSNRHLAIMPSH